MLICHLYVFFGEVSVKVFDTFFVSIGLFVFLLLSFQSSLYILENHLLSDVSFANIFSQSVACLFILLYCLLQNRSLKTLIKFSLSIIDHVFGVVTKEASPYPRLSRFSMLSSVSFIVLIFNLGL